MGEKITPDKYKTKEFARNFIEEKGNATQAYLETYPKCKAISARELGSRKLAKDDTQREIVKLLPKDDVEANIIKTALSAHPKEKEISWSDKHQYLATSLKLKGYLNDKDKQGNTNIAIIIGDRIK